MWQREPGSQELKVPNIRSSKKLIYKVAKITHTIHYEISMWGKSAEISSQFPHIFLTKLSWKFEESRMSGRFYFFKHKKEHEKLNPWSKLELTSTILYTSHTFLPCLWKQDKRESFFSETSEVTWVELGRAIVLLESESKLKEWETTSRIDKLSENVCVCVCLCVRERR